MRLNRLREIREAAGLSQKKMAAIFNCSQQVYSNYELGQRGIPLELLASIVEYFDISADYIIGITDNPKINR